MDDQGSPLLSKILCFFLFLGLNAVITGFQAAVQSLSDSDMEKQEPDKKSEFIDQMRSEKELLPKALSMITTLLAMLTGSTVVTAVIGMGYQMLPAGDLPKFLTLPVLHIGVWILVLLVVLFLFYTFGVCLPQIFASRNPVGWAFRLAGFVKGLMKLTSPVTFLFTQGTYLMIRILGIDPKQLTEDVTEEEIISMVDEGHEQGVLEASEAEMIHNIFEFGDKEAQDIMTHRKHIVAVDGNQTLKEGLDFMLNASNSRFPVYEGDINNITGILHFKDAVKCHGRGIYDHWLIKDIPDLVRAAVFIPETRNVSQLFASMQSKKLQMVIVADEYGQTAGLVALEDILEEIVGNIEDEYDEPEMLIVPCGEDSYLMSGLTPLSDIEDALGIQLSVEEDIETLNGFLISKLEKIPEEDENSIFVEEGYSFQIVSVANKMIQQVRVKKLSPEETAQEESSKGCEKE